MTETNADGPNWILEKCELHGQIAVIVAWYCDGCDAPDDDLRDMARLVGEIPYLLAGRFDLMTDIFSFYDALGMYPHRTPKLEEIYQALREAYAADQDPDRPFPCVVFDSYFEEWVEENI